MERQRETGNVWEDSEKVGRGGKSEGGETGRDGIGRKRKDGSGTGAKGRETGLGKKGQKGAERQRGRMG